MTTDEPYTHGVEQSTSADDEVERRFVDTLRQLSPTPAPVTVVGVAMTLWSIDRTPRGRGLRAQVEDSAGRRFLVSVDAVEFEDSGAASVVEAYQAWLGYDGATTLRPVHAPTTPDTQLEDRAEAIRDVLEEAREDLQDLDVEDVAGWLEDDDPDGRHRRCWSRDAEAWMDVAHALEELPPQLEDLAAAGGGELALELLEELFEVLQSARLGDFVPEQLHGASAGALQVWFKVAAVQLGDDAMLAQLDRWVDELELGTSTGLLLVRVGPPQEPAAIRWLEARLVSERRPETALVSALWTLRLRRGEVKELLEGSPVGLMTESQAVEVIEYFQAAGELDRALELSGQWLSDARPHTPRQRVQRLRCALLTLQGSAEQALDELWASFDAQPSPELYDDLRVLGDDALTQKAAARAARDVRTLIAVAASCDADGHLAAQVANVDGVALRAVSSWSLAPAAARLARAFPEAAVAVYTALGWRHVDRGRAQYYGLALEAFAQARALHLELDHLEVWEAIAAEVEAQHGRKSAFMPGFRRLMAGRRT